MLKQFSSLTWRPCGRNASTTFQEIAEMQHITHGNTLLVKQEREREAFVIHYIL